MSQIQKIPVQFKVTAMLSWDGTADHDSIIKARKAVIEDYVKKLENIMTENTSIKQGNTGIYLDCKVESILAEAMKIERGFYVK